jgi:CheY-like chemotaxis protein
MIEPHRDSSDMYAEFFRHHGVAISNVSNAADALAHTSNVDVVVTNLQLPGDMDGVELIARLRRDERTRHTPVVVVSARAFPHDRDRAADAGCNVFLKKPCLPDTLLWHVRRLAVQPCNCG